MVLELQSHFWLDLHMNLYWNWYRNTCSSTAIFRWKALYFNKFLNNCIYFFGFLCISVDSYILHCMGIILVDGLSLDRLVWEFCIEIDTEVDLELQSHWWTDLCTNLYWKWYRNGPGDPERFLDRFPYEFELKLIKKWTWNSRAICGQICVWIRLEMDTEIDLELESHLGMDFPAIVYWNWYRIGTGALQSFLDHNSCRRGAPTTISSDIYIYIHTYVYIYMFIYIYIYNQPVSQSASQLQASHPASVCVCV
jgi:hypothetical protein